MYEGSQRRFREVAEQPDAVAIAAYEDDTVHDEILSGMWLFLFLSRVEGEVKPEDSSSSSLTPMMMNTRAEAKKAVFSTSLIMFRWCTR